MAIFGSKKKDENKGAAKPVVKAASKAKAVKAPKAAAAVAVKTGAPAVNSGTLSLANIILRPRITEKSGLLSQSGVYTFEVAVNATKETVARAVKSLYKVTPVKVAMVNLPAKRVFIRGRHGLIAGVRKAMVTVKKGEKIDFV